MRILGQGVAFRDTVRSKAYQSPPNMVDEGLGTTEGEGPAQRELEFPRNLRIGICWVMDGRASLDPKPPVYLSTDS